MIKKIIHFSDLHIRLFKDHDLYRDIINNMLEKFREIKPDRIVFTGDLVHSKNQMTPELIEMVAWILSECGSVARTVIIPGNHDFLNNNLNRLDALTPIIDSLENSNIYYYKKMGVYEDENISWCVYSQFDGNVPPDINTAKGYKIGLFHDPVQGMTTDTGYDFGAHGYDIDKFNGLDVVLCGDVHKRQVMKINGGKKLYMIGSTIQQSFGESVRYHGFGVFNVETEDYYFVDLDNPRPFLQFKINSIEDLELGKEELTNY